MKKHFYSALAVAGLLGFAPGWLPAASHHVVPTENPAAAARKAAAAERAAAAQKAAAAKKAAAAAKKEAYRKLAVSRKARKVSAKMRRAVLVVLGLEESKKVTTPHQLRRQLHQHQNYLKMRARQQARARRARAHE